MKQILIVGVGKHGARYVEGIITSKFKNIQTHLLEKECIASKVPANLKKHIEENRNIHIHNSISSLPDGFDLAIVSTSAKERPDIVKTLSANIGVQDWILEKVLSTCNEGLDVISQATAGGKTWVNHPRRISTLYAKLKLLLTNQPLDFTIQWPGLTLGCNSIHFIDIVEWLTGENVLNVNIDKTSGWFEASRPGYHEFDGKILVNYSAGSKLIIDNTGNEIEPNLKISQGKNVITVKEKTGLIINNQFYDGRIEYQSECSGQVVSNILQYGECGLTKLKDSIRQHQKLFEGINNNLLLKKEDGYFPIT